MDLVGRNNDERYLINLAATRSLFSTVTRPNASSGAFHGITEALIRYCHLSLLNSIQIKSILF